MSLFFIEEFLSIPLCGNYSFYVSYYLWDYWSLEHDILKFVLLE